MSTPTTPQTAPPLNIAIHIDYLGTPSEPLCTLGDIRAATAFLPDDTPVYAAMSEQYGDFSGLQIGGSV